MTPPLHQIQDWSMTPLRALPPRPCAAARRPLRPSGDAPKKRPSLAEVAAMVYGFPNLQHSAHASHGPPPTPGMVEEEGQAVPVPASHPTAVEGEREAEATPRQNLTAERRPSKPWLRR